MNFGLNSIVGFLICVKCYLNAAQVTFGSSTPPEVAIPPVLLLKTGDDVRIPCNTTTAAGKVTITWTHETGVFPSNVQQIGADLAITAAQHSDSGIFLCHVNNSAGVSYKLLQVLVDEAAVSGSPSLTRPKVSVVDHKTILYGENVTLNCHVTGSPTPSAIWLFKDRLISGGHLRQEGSKLHVTNATLKEDGTFTCVAKSLAGEARGHVNVYVVGIMPVIDYMTESAYALVGSSVTFRCQASGIPKPSLFWYFISVTGEVGIPESNYQISADHTTLTINSAHQSGTVWCIARNTYGATNAKSYLWIRLPDLIG